MTKRSYLFASAVIISAVSLAAALVIMPHPPLETTDWWGVSTFIAIGILSQYVAIDFGSGRQATSSMAFIPLLASAILFHPYVAIAVPIILISFSEFILNRRAVVKGLFNVSQVVLAVGLASLTFLQFAASGSDEAVPPGAFLALVTVFFTTNVFLSSAAIAIFRQQPFFPTLKVVIGPRGGNLWYDYLASPLVVIAVLLYTEFGIGGLMFVILPLELIRHSYASRRLLEESNRDLLKALIKAIETRDPYTSGHSIRVATLANLIGKELRLPTRQLSNLEWSALLHDVGKIDPIYAFVIQKPYDLTEEERKLIKTHAGNGADFLNGLHSMHADVIKAVRHHHERYDGGGYPDGISGTDIPLYSRIIMLCDSIDAMLSDRPYRKALPINRVTLELSKCAGSQFDPDLVALVIKHRLLDQAAALLVSTDHVPSETRLVALA